MQIQNLSPRTGFFDPAVKLGDEIRAGEPIGIVTDAAGEKSEVVRSAQDGIVLVLRTFSRILKDESVGVILEVELD